MKRENSLNNSNIYFHLQVRTHNLFSEAFVLGQEGKSNTKREERKKGERRKEEGRSNEEAESGGGKEEKEAEGLSLLTLKMAPKYFIPSRSFVPSELSKIESV